MTLHGAEFNLVGALLLALLGAVLLMVAFRMREEESAGFIFMVGILLLGVGGFCTLISWSDIAGLLK